MISGFLEKIVADKKIEVESLEGSRPISVLEEMMKKRDQPRDFLRAISQETLQLIAEIKKFSPSKGLLHPDLDPSSMAHIYRESGAAAISVLTDEKYFQGNLDYLRRVRKEVDLPLLRKDFIIDEYQIYESAAFHADAVLLITAILTPEKLERLIKQCQTLGMDCLVEVHNEDELEKALMSPARIIGINNRDLNTFNVDIETTRRLLPMIPQGIVVVSESGITTREDILKMMEFGVNAVLIGESLVTADDISAKIKELMG
jgi:indole-3-glycerol phosphate synthase